MARKKKHTRRKAGKKRISPAKIFPVRKVMVILACVLIFGAGVYGIRHFLLNSRFFAIKEVIVNREGGYSLDETAQKLKGLYTGRNIFSVDLNRIAAMAVRDFPYLRRAEVRRILPDRLEADLIERTPVALIAFGPGFTIDSDAVVLARDAGGQDLVRIKGVNFFFRTPSPGEKVRTGAVTRALLLLEVLDKKNIIERYNVEYIDVSDRNNMFLCINGVIVKMGSDDFVRKISALNGILNDPGIKITDINYIDLRFEDPVISPK
ncbi:MAG: FtsQ-type POTRA domain-containing protein [Candidatus Omnitrophica bacterium]|nr:FtsQ-type POTRA domain-containing protein [Candidatus Omnitrophota bacterium]